MEEDTVNIFNGTVVKACAGRDSGGYFVVVTCDDSGFIYLADGKSRKLSKPKKKNVKHLQLTKTVIDLDGYSDKRLRRFLREYSLGILDAEEYTNV
jgi:ribosomal protein L14E/L6E/L27E